MFINTDSHLWFFFFVNCLNKVSMSIDNEDKIEIFLITNALWKYPHDLASTIVFCDTQAMFCNIVWTEPLWGFCQCKFILRHPMFSLHHLNSCK